MPRRSATRASPKASASVELIPLLLELGTEAVVTVSEEAADVRETPLESLTVTETENRDPLAASLGVQASVAASTELHPEGRPVHV